MIVEKIDRYMQSQIKIWPCNVNRASSIGHPCDRYLVFVRTRGNEQKLHSLDTQYIFNEGNVQERAVLRLLDEAGIEVVEQQRPFEWKEHQITGHIDGKVMVGNDILPLEIKSMSPWIWEKTTTLQDMLSSKYHWVRHYPAQLTMYMLMDNKERSLFLLKNKTSGRLKEIEIILDLDYAESLVCKAERVNLSIANHVVPEPISWGDVCAKCPFNSLCIQDVLREELEFVVDPDASDKLEGWFELKQWSDKWKELDEWRKEHFRGVERLVVDQFLITGKATTKGWRTTITRI